MYLGRQPKDLVAYEPNCGGLLWGKESPNTLFKEEYHEN